MNKKILLILAAAVTIAAIINLKFISFDNNVNIMLPSHPKIEQSLNFLQKEEFSGKVILWLQLKSDKKNTQDLIRTAKNLEKSLNSPLITKVNSGFTQENFLKKALILSKYTGQIINPNRLDRIEEKITAKNINQKLANIYTQVLSPASAFSLLFMRNDPLGIHQQMLLKLKKLSQSSGYNISLYRGRFISEDGKNTMLIIDTPVEITDINGSAQLMGYLQNQLKELPEFVSGKIISAHKHTLSNQEVLKNDIRLTVTIVTLSFLLLFLVYFRDPKAFMVFILPFASILVAISLSSFILEKVSYFIVGMGVVVAGIAIDYGIHVYVAVRNKEQVKQVSKPITIGALTTTSVFLAFLFSSTSGYRQLGLFSIFSILLCLFYSLFLLPDILGKTKKIRFFKLDLFKGPDKPTVIVWIIGICILIFLAGGFYFSGDIERFDGSKKDVIKTEKEFNKVWQVKSEPAIFVTEAKTLRKLRVKNDNIYKQANKKIGDEFISFSSVWPSYKERKRRYNEWQAFWKKGNEERLKKIISRHIQEYNFSPHIFKPFFDNLYTETIPQEIPEELSFLNEIKNRFLLQNKDGYKMISFFPDTEKNLELIQPIADNHENSFIVSRKALSKYISKAVSEEVVFLCFLAVSLIFLLTFILLRSIPLALLSLVSPFTAVLAILAIPKVFSQPFNAPGIISAMVVIGLSIDYGIFMVYNIRYKLKAQTPLAVSLSAVTTLIGSGVLIFARHPVLYSIGLVLVTGVTTGYLTAFFVIPALYRLCFKKVI